MGLLTPLVVAVAFRGGVWWCLAGLPPRLSLGPFVVVFSALFPKFRRHFSKNALCGSIFAPLAFSQIHS